MKSAIRRRERENPEVLQFLSQRYPRGLLRDWSEDNEEKGMFLEGTGSLVIDHSNRVAYACISERTDLDLSRRWADFHRYELVSFHASDKGVPVYHTNVVMAIGQSLAVVALELMSKEDQHLVQEKLEAGGKVVIPISAQQTNEFCGNILELSCPDGRLLAMSSRAFRAFTSEQLSQMRASGIEKIVHADISTLENIGGGSCRCMLAELF